MNYRDGKPTVLVVEDDSGLLQLLVKMLASGGFDTVAAGRAADGLSLVRQRQGAFDLAIVDMVMPGMSGLDLATDLGREYPSLKILYISGYAGSLAADALSRRTPDRVLLKPFTEQTLLERVRMLLEIAPRREPGQAAQTPGSAYSQWHVRVTVCLSALSWLTTIKCFATRLRRSCCVTRSSTWWARLATAPARLTYAAGRIPTWW